MRRGMGRGRIFGQLMNRLTDPIPPDSIRKWRNRVSIVAAVFAVGGLVMWWIDHGIALVLVGLSAAAFGVSTRYMQTTESLARRREDERERAIDAGEPFEEPYWGGDTRRWAYWGLAVCIAVLAAFVVVTLL